jgi:hypothetical protein
MNTDYPCVSVCIRGSFIASRRTLRGGSNVTGLLSSPIIVYWNIDKN